VGHRAERRHGRADLIRALHEEAALDPTQLPFALFSDCLETIEIIREEVELCLGASLRKSREREQIHARVAQRVQDASQLSGLVGDLDVGVAHLANRAWHGRSPQQAQSRSKYTPPDLCGSSPARGAV